MANYEIALTKGSEHIWPIWLKVGLFSAERGGKAHFDIRARPLFLLYLFLPGILKFWVSIEKDVISVCYYGFIKCPYRRNIND